MKLHNCTAIAWYGTQCGIGCTILLLWLLFDQICAPVPALGACVDKENKCAKDETNHCESQERQHNIDKRQ
eukprot:354669-Karenia_brevis.AAC.1